jgi:hypothetical protein
MHTPDPYSLYKSLTLLEWPNAFSFLLLAHTINAVQAVAKRTGPRSTDKTFWLHHLLMTFFAGYSGGFLAPLLIGERPIWYGNDSVIIMVIVVWYMVRYLDMNWFFEIKIVKHATLICVALFRAHTNINMTMRANSIIPGNIYPVAIWGPIFTATLLGSGGLFFPHKGDGWLSVSKSVPWALEGSFLCSCFTHFMINDTDGTFGNILRVFIPQMTLPEVRMAMSTMHLVVVFAQYIYSDPSLEFFTIISDTIDYILHFKLNTVLPIILALVKNLGAIVGVGGSGKAIKQEKTHEKFSLFKYFNIRTGALVAFLVAYFIEQMRHGPHLVAGTTHALTLSGRPMVSCRFLPELTGCKPYAFEFQRDEATSSYSLSMSAKTKKLSETIDSRKLWSASVKYPAGTSHDDTRVIVTKEGVLLVENTVSGKVLWKSNKKCKEPGPVVYMYIDESGGRPMIYCSDKETIVP